MRDRLVNFQFGITVPAKILRQAFFQMPPDAEIIRAFDDPHRNMYGFTVWSKEFAPVPVGAPIPAALIVVDESEGLTVTVQYENDLMARYRRLAQKTETRHGQPEDNLDDERRHSDSSQGHGRSASPEFDSNAPETVRLATGSPD